MDGLEAIIPISPNSSYYHYYRSYGLVRSPGGYPGEDVDVLFDFIHSGCPDLAAARYGAHGRSGKYDDRVAGGRRVGGLRARGEDAIKCRGASKR